VGSPKNPRLPVGFTPALHAAIAERASRMGLSLSATVRHLVAAALHLDTELAARAASAAEARLAMFRETEQ
jgi:hypothetical protein